MPTSEIKTVSNCKKEVEVTVSVNELDKIRKEQTQLVSREAQAPGFRKGKVPAAMVQRMYGDTIERHTLDEAIQFGFEESMKEQQIAPVGTPKVTHMDFDEEKNLKLKFEIEVWPEIELKKYKGLKLEKTIYSIDDADVEAELKRLQYNYASISAKEGPAGIGDRLTLTLQELDESGMPLVGKKYENVTLELGKGFFDAKMEEQLEGIKTGESRNVEMTVDTGPAGKSRKTERYSVTAEKVEKIELPELDDEFVKDLDSGVETVEELRKRIRENMEQYWAQQSEQKFFNTMAHEMLQNNPFDIPEALVENYLDRIVAEIKQKEQNLDERKVRDNYRSEAAFNIKWFHLKEKIAEVENITVGEEDLKDYLSKIEDPKQREFLEKNKEYHQRILDDIREKKILDFLVENSKITEKTESIHKGKDLIEA